MPGTTKRDRRAAKRRKKERAKQKAQAAKARTSALPKRFTLYCDEAGNTGINYLDPEQPVHVIAGWLVRDHRTEAWAAEIDKIRTDHGTAELHGVKLLKSNRGLDVAVKVLETSLRHGAFPVSLVAFKGHSLSLRAVEAFMDPAHNRAAYWLPTGADESRREIATLLWENATDGIRSFGQAIKNPDPHTWTQIALDLSRALGSSTSSDISMRAAETLKRAADPDVISNIVEAEQVTPWGSGKRYESMSLNFPMFLTLLRNTDELVTSQNGICHVIHDETRQFESSFQQGVEFFAQIGRIDARREDGSVYRLVPESFKSFRTSDSKALPALQAADVLASSIYLVAKHVAQNKKLSKKKRPLAALSLGHLAPMAIARPLSTIPGVGSKDEIIRLHKTAFDAAKEYYL